MVANRGDRSDGDHRDASRSRTRRHSHTSRSKRDRYDQDSVDSGYGGSSDFPSPKLSKHTGSGGTRKQDADKDSNADDHGHGTDSDSDYDPKAKYYLSVDDNDYKNISFQGGEAPDQPETSKAKGERQGDDDDYMTRRRRSNHDWQRPSSDRRRRSKATSDSDSGSDSDGYSRGYQGRSRRRSSRHYSDSSRSRPRRDSYRHTLSPIMSEPSEDWRDYSPEKQALSRPQSPSRSPSRSTRRRRGSSAGFTDVRSPLSDVDDRPPVRSSEKSRRSRTRSRTTDEKEDQKRELSRGDSSSYKGPADMTDAWYKTFKERLTKGVDMKQVRKVGLDAAAVAAVKVAVGTQVPWKQRIPKTIAVGLAAAVTDFLVSKTIFQPKGMVGTVYVRQFVEIALANLIINPASNKVHQKFSGSKPAQASGPGTNNAAKVSGGRARR